MKSRKMRWAELVVRMDEKRKACRILMGSNIIFYHAVALFT
jgi:hypothetical protein